MNHIEQTDIAVLMELKEKIKNYSLKKLKKIGNKLNVISNDTGVNLLFLVIDDLPFMERLIQAGVDINCINLKGHNLTDIALESKQPYKTMKLLCKYNINLQQEGMNILLKVGKILPCDNEEELHELSKVQLLILSTNINTLLKPPVDKNSHEGYEQLRILSSLTPDSLRYLKNYRNIDILKINDAAEQNLLFYLIDSPIYKYHDISFKMLDKLLKMMTKEEVNSLNSEQDNILWEISSYEEEQLSIFKKNGLDFKHINKYGQSALESSYCIYDYEMAEKFLQHGVELGQECIHKVLSENEEEIKQYYKWDERTYQLLFSLAHKQHSTQQKKEIIESLNETNSNIKMRKNRL